ncbi:hypothetical protein H2200_007561 [Cladophialophora chaetospira]|uniref:Heterokaryon incompatibility domain-containing protein n=1 Tax=Cladophialophora chaetospira TaxID=386627 RepID=A0AA39CGQ1_9EURO|nr:hypothetical protein H2200_007561 [Cladophialophora chaetospira]
MGVMCRKRSSNGKTGTRLPQYRHKPLDQRQASIRLIRVLPRLRKGLLQVELIQSRTTNSYTALSYVWGPDERRSIWINHNLYTVRKNLWSFLVYARTALSRFWLWIDAICIDQKNTTERNHQVQQMSKIYSSATMTWIWLGPKKLFDADLWQTKMQRPVIYTEVSTRLFSELRAVISQEYWQRLWVIQEVFHSEDITMLDGFSQLPWDLFNTVYTSHSNSLPYSSTLPLGSSGLLADAICHLRESWSEEYLPLSELLEHFSHSQCSDARDRIFGLLGIVKEGRVPPVDYSKDPVHLFYKVLAHGNPDEWATSASIKVLRVALGLQFRDLRVSVQEKDTSKAVLHQNSQAWAFFSYEGTLMPPCMIFNLDGTKLPSQCSNCEKGIYPPDPTDCGFRSWPGHDLAYGCLEYDPFACRSRGHIIFKKENLVNDSGDSQFLSLPCLYRSNEDNPLDIVGGLSSNLNLDAREDNSAWIWEFPEPSEKTETATIGGQLIPTRPYWPIKLELVYIHPSLKMRLRRRKE